jgi:hypothetical protein
MKLKDLNTFNEMVDHVQRLDVLHYLREGLNLACPRCNKELYDLDDEVKTGFPATIKIHCPECKWRGYRSCL